MAQDGDNNVLATPHILALDNQDATISIGQNIPLQTERRRRPRRARVGRRRRGRRPRRGGSASACSGRLLGAAPGHRHKIKIKPHVNDSDQVRLELPKRSPTPARRRARSAPSPSTSAPPRRSSSSAISRPWSSAASCATPSPTDETKDPHPRRHPRARLPLQQKQSTKTKSNLLLILTPYVIRSPEGPARHLRAQDAGAAGVHRPVLRLQRGRDLDPAKDFRHANGLRRGHPPVDDGAGEREKMQARGRCRKPSR